jgi:hypothetical protein
MAYVYEDGRKYDRRGLSPYSRSTSELLGEDELCNCVRGGGHYCEKANLVSDFLGGLGLQAHILRERTWSQVTKSFVSKQTKV